MATSTICKFEGKEISINQALIIREKDKSNRFFCTECDQEVKPHSGGGHTNAHFEHKKRNNKCSLSHNSETYKYISENENDEEYLLNEIFDSILENSTNLINGQKVNVKQLRSAKNYVCNHNFDQWTFGKSITTKSKQFSDGGQAKKFLYKYGFINILSHENEQIKLEIISKFKTWASMVSVFDLITKFNEDQNNLKRVELLVHETVLKKFIKSFTAENSDDEALGREEYYQRKQRTNQGLFRKKMIRYWKGCCITGINDLNFLIASHIKPWKDCEPEEKLSLDNGLLLAAPIDFLFDNYLISFEDDGIAIISNKAKSVLHHFTLLKEIKISKALNSNQKEFMKYHRDLFEKKKHDRITTSSRK